MCVTRKSQISAYDGLLPIDMMGYCPLFSLHQPATRRRWRKTVKLTRLDFILGAIDRLAVRRGIDRATVEQLLHTRAKLSKGCAKALAGHWFNREYRHGGIEYRRQEYLASREAT